MSKLDKEKVIAEFTEAYQKANGKKPKIEDNNGWYSVDGGKNVRLAQLDEEAKSLAKGSSKSEPKKTTEKKKAEPAKKAPAKTKSTAKKPAAKKSTPAKKAAKPAAKTQSSTKKSSSSNSNGLTAKELWRQRLESSDSKSRLPRGL